MSGSVPEPAPRRQNNELIIAAAQDIASQASEEPDPLTKSALKSGDKKAQQGNRTTPAEFNQHRLVKYHEDHCELIVQLRSEKAEIQHRLDRSEAERKASGDACNSETTRLKIRIAQYEQAERANSFSGWFSSGLFTVATLLTGLPPLIKAIPDTVAATLYIVGLVLALVALFVNFFSWWIWPAQKV